MGGGGGRKTVYQTTRTPNDYDDAWIRSKFSQLDQQALGFSNWQAGRQASLGREAELRSENRAAIQGLRTGAAASAANIANLQKGQSGLTANFQGLNQSQQQQMKDLYNLSQKDKTVKGVKTAQGMTFTQPGKGGTKSLGRAALTTSALNI